MDDTRKKAQAAGFWVGKAPRPELMPRAGRGTAGQTKVPEFWAGKAPQPGLMPDIRATRVEARLTSRSTIQPAVATGGAPPPPPGGGGGGGKGPPKWPDFTDTHRKQLGKGTWRGKLIYIHYTDLAGLLAIFGARRITDARRGETRAGSKGGIYVNPPSQMFNPSNVETLLFLGNERYVGRGDYVVIFTADNEHSGWVPVTSESWVLEGTLSEDVVLTGANVLYMGPNPFPDVFEPDDGKGGKQ
ncbi:hypothetical protein [Paraliomyxa miuraensis]|uniref:hypothetical protein n=1 Tax=Paraliomyxa miuraensis TaxID=376150 RepID=UPI002253C504|nr:hypothetical protein [Paraliomyxa miuraensis]MCX4243136.1 hypothetical protein [Paraliomyxa miuraensis]